MAGLDLGSSYGAAGAADSLEQLYARRRADQLLELQRQALAEQAAERRDRLAAQQAQQARMAAEHAETQRLTEQLRVASLLPLLSPGGEVPATFAHTVERAYGVEPGEFPTLRRTPSSLEPGGPSPPEPGATVPEAYTFLGTNPQAEAAKRDELAARAVALKEGTAHDQGEARLRLLAAQATLAEANARLAQTKSQQDPGEKIFTEAIQRKRAEAMYRPLSQAGQRAATGIYESVPILNDLEDRLRQHLAAQTAAAAAGTPLSPQGMLAAAGRKAGSMLKTGAYRLGLPLPGQDEAITQLAYLERVVGSAAYMTGSRSYLVFREALKHLTDPAADPAANLQRIATLKATFPKMLQEIYQAERPANPRPLPDELPGTRFNWDVFSRPPGPPASGTGVSPEAPPEFDLVNGHWTQRKPPGTRP